MIMRVAVGIHKNNIERVLETYDLMSRMFFTHATPTLFNAGTPRPQLASCFLMTMQSDSIEGIYDTLSNCAAISKYAGGIGLSIHDIRASGSYIAGTNGTSNGIVPMLRVFNNTARYVDQGGGKRKGSFAIYLEPWHADVFDFLELKKNHGKGGARARPVLCSVGPRSIYEACAADGSGPFSANEAPGLSESHSAEFEALYERYEAEAVGSRRWAEYGLKSWCSGRDRYPVHSLQRFVQQQKQPTKFGYDQIIQLVHGDYQYTSKMRWQCATLRLFAS